ncbi:dihydrofolate reductase family protein [Nocardia jinanensis]|uniref:Dihydrofolate reductase n=1 Tax=Nocardia jinanensis TaxID=382504 RepID=A0A917R701_9NOCA|nr:dihydrofolate reductase family protein [Nocardia jinanensis]GGK92609.1 dihydrofolate reductase [Nocardia jinanensis]
MTTHASAPRTIYNTATSLDGFIATTGHSLDWLLTREADEDGPMGMTEFMAGVGAIVMGANTYQWLLDNQSAEPWPYEVPTWVCTHREFAPRTDGDVRFTGEPVELVHKAMAEAAAGKNLWIVGGGELAGQFADHGLLDEVIVSTAPVTLGSGAPLLPRRLELRVAEMARNGEFTCARYTVVGPDA